MSEEKKVYHTDDPILLAALNGTDPPGATTPKKKGSSNYRGISKKGKAGRWRASVGAGGKDYELGSFASEEEAALARNFGEELVPGARRVANIIPPEKMPDEAARKRVAATVVTLLRRKGALPDVEEGDSPQEPRIHITSDHQPENT